MRPERKLILGSSSPWRSRILEQAGYSFDILSPDIDEAAFLETDPVKRASTLAHAKADALLETVCDPAILITSDQVVRFGSETREKPRDPEECRRYLRSYDEDHPGETVTAIVLTDTVTRLRVEGIDVARQYLLPLPDKLIEELIRDGDVMRCAGGFRIEDPKVAPYLARRDGSPDSIMGMPLRLLGELLKAIRNEILRQSRKRFLERPNERSSPLGHGQ